MLQHYHGVCVCVKSTSFTGINTATRCLHSAHVDLRLIRFRGQLAGFGLKKSVENFMDEKVVENERVSLLQRWIQTETQVGSQIRQSFTYLHFPQSQLHFQKVIYLFRCDHLRLSMLVHILLIHLVFGPLQSGKQNIHIPLQLHIIMSLGFTTVDCTPVT